MSTSTTSVLVCPAVGRLQAGVGVLAVVVLGLAGCSDGGSGDSAATTTTTTTPTTIDQTDTIRRFAAVVAEHRPLVVDALDGCYVQVPCVVDATVAWRHLADGLHELGMPPDAIAPLVKRIADADPAIDAAATKLRTCLDVNENDAPYVKCVLEAKDLRDLVAAQADTLGAWDAYT